MRMPTLHFRVLFVATALLTFFMAVGAGWGAGFRDIARSHPDVAAMWSADALLPSAPLVRDDISPSNVAVSSDGRGFYAIAPYADIRDDQGVLIEPNPVLVRRGAWYRPMRAGDLSSAAFPSTGNSWVILGEGLKYRLGTRRAVAPSIRRGAALYEGALAGADQLVLVRADEAAVEEWLIVAKGSRPFSARYELSLSPGAKVQAKRGRIVVRPASGETTYEISAPIALDENGGHFPVSLRLAANKRSFTVAVNASGAVGSLAIDPIFRRVVNDDSPDNSYSGEVCGQLASSDQDYPGWDGFNEADNPWNEGYVDPTRPTEFEKCVDSNAGPLVDFSPNADGDATDDFEGIKNVDGVTLRVKDGRSVAATDSAFAAITAPANVGIVESGFRGHTGDFGTVDEPRYRCKVEIGGPHSDRFGQVDADIINTPWNVADNAPKTDADWKNRYLFAGYPYGSTGGGEWSIFPFEGNGSVGPGYLYPSEVLFDEARGVSENRHMWGYFTMNLNSGVPNTAFRAAPGALTLAKMPSQVRMRLDPRVGFTAKNAGNACSADSRWRVVFHDPIDPTVKEPAIDPGWHSGAEAAAANAGVDAGGNLHPWRYVDARDPDGSGIRRVRSLISDRVTDDAQVTYPASEGFQLGWNPCGDSVRNGQISRIRTDLAQPCPMTAAGHVLKSAADPELDPSKTSAENTLSRSFFRGSGAHRMQWTTQDFAGRDGESEVFPVGAARNTVPRAPRADSKGWIWIDDQKPSCTLSRISVVGKIAYVRGSANETEFYADPVGGVSYGVRRGSGVARVQLWQVPYGGSLSSSGATLIWDTAQTGELGADALRNGVESYSISRDITLTGDVAESGDFEMIAVAIDGVGQVSDICEGRPDPCTDVSPGELRLIKGATGVAAVWTLPTGRVATDSVGRLTATVDGSPAPVIQGRDKTAFVRAAPGELVKFTMTAACDPPGMNPTVTKDVSKELRVDQRPSITGLGGYGLPKMWIDAWDGLPNAGADPTRFDGKERNDHVEFSIVDPDDEIGAASVNDANADIPEYTFPPTGSGGPADRQVIVGDRQIAIVRIADRTPADDDPLTAANDPSNDSGWLVVQPREIGGGAAKAWIVDDIADIDERGLNPVPGAAPDQTCDLSAPATGVEHVVVSAGRWELDCTKSSATRPDLATGGANPNRLDLSLALRAIGNGKRIIPLTTPDEDYDVSIWLRDQRQPADNEYLTQDADPPAVDASGVVVDSDKTPPPGAGIDESVEANQSTWIDAGDLRTDRIEPTIRLTDSTERWAWYPGERVNIALSAIDPTPSANAADNTNTRSRVASGLRLITDIQTQVETAPGTWTTIPGTTSTCGGTPAPSTCTVSFDLPESRFRLPVRIVATVVDNAFNFTRTPMRLAAPRNDCYGYNGQYPHIEPYPGKQGNGPDASPDKFTFQGLYGGSRVADIDPGDHTARIDPNNLHLQCIGDGTGLHEGQDTFPVNGAFKIVGAGPDNTGFLASVDANGGATKVGPNLVNFGTGEFQRFRAAAADMDGNGTTESIIESITRFRGRVTIGANTTETGVIRVRYRRLTGIDNVLPGTVEVRMWLGNDPVDEANPDLVFSSSYNSTGNNLVCMGDTRANSPNAATFEAAGIDYCDSTN